MRAWRGFMVGAVLFCASAFGAGAGDLSISSPAFAEGKAIPSDYAYKSGNQSPELRISGVPTNAKSLVLIVDDPDAPSGLWTHWVVWNIDASTKEIAAGSVPHGAVQGNNSFGDSRYDGPAPPSGTHRYFFHVYALDAVLTVTAGAGRDAVEAAMQGHVVAKGEMLGTYAASL